MFLFLFSIMTMMLENIESSITLHVFNSPNSINYVISQPFNNTSKLNYVNAQEIADQLNKEARLEIHKLMRRRSVTSLECLMGDFCEPNSFLK